MKKLQLQLVGKGERRTSKPLHKSITFRDMEVLEMIESYAQKHKLKFSFAIEELLTLAFEFLEDAKLADIVHKVRDKNRAAMVANRTFDFRKDCFGCGAKDSLVFIHGHVQCRECGCNVEPCCDD